MTASAHRGRAVPALVPAVQRAMALLELVAEERMPLSLARMTHHLGLPKSSVHGLCTTLLSLGYLRRQGDAGFAIGPGVMRLADAFTSGISVAQEFAALWQQTDPPQETVILSVLSGSDVMYLAIRNGSRPLGLAFNVGMKLPAHLAASGKAMLAFMPEAAVRRLLPEQPLKGWGPRPPPDAAGVLAELDQVRQRGYSVDDEGVREGVHCIGAPVFDATGLAVAGIGVCMQKTQLAPALFDTQRDMVMHVAELLSRRIGGRSSVPEKTTP